LGGCGGKKKAWGKTGGGEKHQGGIKLRGGKKKETRRHEACKKGGA